MEKRSDFGARPAGMTLVELATVISVLGILALIGIPGLSGSIQRTGIDGASRRLAEDIRLAQSNALTRGVQARLIIFDQTGLVPTTPTAINDPTRANMYRIELCTSSCSSSTGWPTPTATPGSDSNVLTVWNDLGSQYHGVAVTTGNAVIFNSNGSLINLTVPANIVVGGPGGTRTIQTSLIGKATIL